MPALACILSVTMPINWLEWRQGLQEMRVLAPELRGFLSRYFVVSSQVPCRLTAAEVPATKGRVESFCSRTRDSPEGVEEELYATLSFQ